MFYFELIIIFSTLSEYVFSSKTFVWSLNFISTTHSEGILVTMNDVCLTKQNSHLFHGGEALHAFLANKKPDITEAEILNEATAHVVEKFTGRVA